MPTMAIRLPFALILTASLATAQQPTYKNPQIRVPQVSHLRPGSRIRPNLHKNPDDTP